MAGEEEDKTRKLHTAMVVFANLAFVVDSSASEILKISEVNGGSRVQRMVP